MATRTREKLEEAQFFLERMREARTGRRIPFVHYFSAFVSAARSTTYVMQQEYDGTPGFSDWYSRKQDEMKQNPLWHTMKTVRDLQLHSKDARPSLQVKMPVGDNALVIHGVELVGTNPEGAVVARAMGEAVISAPPGTQVQWVLALYGGENINQEVRKKLEGADIMALSEDWASRLAALVTEWEGRIRR